MIKIASLSIAGALLAFGLSAAPAHAQANRTFVSGKGTDSGTCALVAPCLTFAFAVTQTAASGEIDVLDTADYGVLTINKSISIVNDGAGVASIEANDPSGNGVTINAGANDSVHLRGLTIEGLRSGSAGIRFNTGRNLTIENCVIRNFTLAGIAITPSTSSNFSVSNTIASDNPNEGIAINPQGAAVVNGVLSKVTANRNDDGIFVSGQATTGLAEVTIVDSEASNNSVGVRMQKTAVMVRNVVASYNSRGLDAEPNSILRVAHSVVTGNNVGLRAIFGGLFSYGDNNIDGNRSNGTNDQNKIPTH